jgi:hypothetical protein
MSPVLTKLIVFSDKEYLLYLSRDHPNITVKTLPDIAIITPTIEI